MEANRLPITWVFLYGCTPEQQNYLRAWLAANAPQFTLPLSKCYIGSHHGMIFQVNGRLDAIISKGLITYTKFVELTETPVTAGTIVEVRQHLNASWEAKEFASMNLPRKSGAIYKTSDGHSWMYMRRVSAHDAELYKAAKLADDLKKAAKLADDLKKAEEKTSTLNINTATFGQATPTIVRGIIGNEYVCYEVGVNAPDVSRGWAVLRENNTGIANWLSSKYPYFTSLNTASFIGVDADGNARNWSFEEFVKDGFLKPGGGPMAFRITVHRGEVPLITYKQWLCMGSISSSQLASAKTKELIRDKPAEPTPFKQP